MENFFKKHDSDSTLTYFSKETENSTPIILKHTLNFKIGRIFGKCLFVCSLLNNIRAIVLKQYKIPIRSKAVSSFYIEDKQKWSGMFGGSHIKSPIFSLKNKRNGVSKK